MAPDELLTERSVLYRRALELIPGGVNSPVRAMRAVGLDEPIFVESGSGAYIETADGRVALVGPLRVAVGSRTSFVRSRTCAAVAPGDEVIARGRLERVADGDGTAYRAELALLSRYTWEE